MRIKKKLSAKKQLEDKALKEAIDKGKTNKFVNTKEFLKSLEK